MFIGRKRELDLLKRIYKSDKFEFLVLYGQRRIGKTTLLGQFSSNIDCIFFTAKETNDLLNLREFSQTVLKYFGFAEGSLSFDSWQAVFSFVAKQAQTKKVLLIIDEYPYAATANPSLNSILQAVIDHEFTHTKLKLILSGSHVSFMEQDVLGKKSPLFGRKTVAPLQLKPFDYYETGQMLTGFDSLDKLRFYAILGGIPYYLSFVDNQADLATNLERLFFTSNADLLNEPELLLKEEFREASIYNAVITAVARGANKPSKIATASGIDTSSLSFYLKSLLNIGFLEKKLPFGDNPLTSRKGIYNVKTNLFKFWYNFVYPNLTAIELGLGQGVMTKKVLPQIDDFLAKEVFEEIALEYLLRQIRAGKIDLLPTEVGKWWGNDNLEKKQTDIDVVCGDGSHALLGECKWRDSFKEIKELEKLLGKGRLLKGYQTFDYYFFAKKTYGDATKQFANGLPNVHLITAADFFD